jgi:molybdopterin converting factor small subunit
MISKKYLKNNLENLSKTAAFFSEADEVVDDNYKLKNKELISIIPPIGGG